MKTIIDPTETDRTNAAARVDRTGHTYPTPARPRRFVPEWLPENQVALTSLRQHSAAWRTALQTVQPTPIGRRQRMQQWALAWAIALTLSIRRGLARLTYRLAPPALRDSAPLSIHRLDTRGPVVELRIRAAYQQHDDRLRQGQPSQTPMGSSATA